MLKLDHLTIIAPSLAEGVGHVRERLIPKLSDQNLSKPTMTYTPTHAERVTGSGQ